MVAGCTERGALAPPTLEPLEVQVEGEWLRDRAGRVVLLRGVTLSALEQGRFVGAAGGPREADFRELEQHGFNVIRVLLPWSRLQPREGDVDFGFLTERVNPVVRLAAKHGMLVVLTLYQRGWSRCFAGGVGAPLWSCAEIRGRDDPAAVDESVCSFLEGKPQDGVNLRQEFVTLWSEVARFYGADKRVVGFDLLEEPPDLDCPSGRSGDLLRKLYRRVHRELVRQGARQVLFFDPAVRADGAMPAKLPSRRVSAVFAPHLFSQTFGAPPGIPTAIALARGANEAAALARTSGAVFFAGELGGDLPAAEDFRPLSPGFVDPALALLDQHLAGGTLFISGGRQPNRLQQRVSLALAKRPWARRIAGVPATLRFDRTSGSYLLVFAEDETRRVSDPTEIFVPRSVYPDGFDVRVLPEGRWRYDEHTERLLVYRSGAPGHAVHLTRREPAPLPAARVRPRAPRVRARD